MSSYKTYVGKFANFIGGLGYINVAFQWIWSSIPILYPLIATKGFQHFLMPIAPTESSSPTSATLVIPPAVEVLLVAAAVIFSISVMIYAIFAVPKGFGKAGKTITTKSADIIIPTITRHQKISKKRQRTLLNRISWSIKAGLIVIPAALLFIPTPKDLGLTQAQFIAAGVILAIWSALLFTAQFILARIARLKAESIW